MRGATDWLRAEGYRFETAAVLDGFVAVVARDDERWLGWGSTPDAAIGHALAQAFPSGAARALLERFVESTEDEQAVHLIADRDALEVPVERNHEETIGASPSDAADPPSPSGGLPDAAHADAGAIPIDEARAELDALADRIESARPELAFMAPELQRLHMTAWIARARAVQEAIDDEDAGRTVAGIAARLTDLAKLWWPGSVIALQLDCRPRDAARSVGVPNSLELRTWADVADAVEDHARNCVETYGSHGLDGEGWADASLLAPNAPDGLGVLAEARMEIESVLGSIDARPDPSARAALVADLDGAQATLAAARKLRWIRGAVSAPELWARALGRLRWAFQQRVRGAELLAELLDPDYAPAQPWAAVLGRDPIAMERRRRRKAVLRGVPAPGSDVATVRQWLVDAFEVGGDELPVDRIARHAAAFADAIGEIDPMSLASLHRKKLGKLKQRLGLLVDAEPDERPSTAGVDEEPRAHETAPDPHELLARAIRDAIEGRRALFVSNRSDPELQRSLEDVLGVDPSWCESDPRRVQSACERIGSGSFDLVLCATGFADHSVDAQLYRAARSAGVRYCRVGSGRPRSCVRALASQLGVRAS